MWRPTNLQKANLRIVIRANQQEGEGKYFLTIEIKL